jgi:hypothetical protein
MPIRKRWPSWLGLETLTLLAAVDLLANARFRYPSRTPAPVASE